ncbi:prolactin releasing hormone 2 isoform X2 [Scleropages formosus]|nr:prolactin-releasing peptide isoform X2 [Scleropages formosus]
MPPARGARPAAPCARRPSLATLTAAYAALLLLSASVACARGSTLRHELHTGHNVDNRSPEIDPFWYVGRGVRPIGRFGKRQNTSGGLGPLAGTLELLLGSLRGKELRGLAKTLAGENADWLP